MKKYLIVVACIVIFVGVTVFSLVVIPRGEQVLTINVASEMFLKVDESKKLIYDSNIKDVIVIAGIEDQTIATHKAKNSDIYIFGSKSGNTFLNLTFKYKTQSINEKVELKVTEDIKKDAEPNLPLADVDDFPNEDDEKVVPPPESSPITIRSIRNCEVEGEEIRVKKAGEIYVSISSEEEEEIEVDTELKIKKVTVSNTYIITVETAGEYRIKIKIRNKEFVYKIIL